jgi:GTPase
MLEYRLPLEKDIFWLVLLINKNLLLYKDINILIKVLTTIISTMKIFYSEPDKGNLEYKLHLSDFNYEKFQRYSTQLKYRILEGAGYAIYIIGITDKGSVVGIPLSEINYTIDKFNYICSNVNCKIDLIMKCVYKDCNFLIIKVSALFDIDELPFLI